MSHYSSLDNGSGGALGGNNVIDQITILPTSSGVMVLMCASWAMEFELVNGKFESPECADVSLVLVTNTALSKTAAGDTYRLVFHGSQEVLEFHGLDASLGATRGRLKSRTNLALEDIAGLMPEEYFYVSTGNAAGKVDYVTTAEGWLVDYDYNNNGRLQSVISYAGPSDTDDTHQKVEYTYYEDLPENTSLGSIGDLVQVKKYRRASGDAPGVLSIERVTQYRYYTENSTNGTKHQIKAIYADDDLRRLIAASGSGVLLGDVNQDGLVNFTDISPFIALLSSGNYQAEADINQDGVVNFLDVSLFIAMLSGGLTEVTFGNVDDVLAASSDAVIAGHPLSNYAGQRTTYYTGPESTGSIDTPWTTGNEQEDLHDKYGGSELNEFSSVTNQGRVKSQTVGSSGCTSCGGGDGITKFFYYMNSPQTGQMIVVEDLEDGNDTPISRLVRTLNEDGVEIRTAKIENPDETNLRAWCTSIVLDSEGRITKTRDALTHKGIDSKADLKTFLDPASATPFNTNNEGVITIYERGATPALGDGRVTGVRIQQNGVDDAHYVSATDWENFGTGDVENYLPTATYRYLAPTTVRNDDTKRIKTSMTYKFWDGDGESDTGLVMKTATTTQAAVSDPQNGSDEPTVTTNYYDRRGRLRWTQDGEGYVTYYAHHPVFGGTALVVRDVNPGSLPDVVSFGEADAIDSYTVDEANTNMPSRTGLPPALALESKTYYDDQARGYKRVDSTGQTHYSVYNDREMIQFPNFDGTKSLTPISITKQDLQGNTTERIQIRADIALTVPDEEPTGFSSALDQENDYVSWTRMFYDDAGEQLLKTLTYHNIPDSGNGAVGINYHISANHYDAQDRVTHRVQTVSANNHQITKTDYDWMGRATKSYSGTGNSGLNTGANNLLGISPPNGTLALRSSQEYDDGGVGNSRVTSSKRYYGSGNDYMETIPQYTWRGFVRGNIQKNGNPEVPGTPDYGPWTVRDLDWQGRTVASASYETQPDWTAVLNSETYVVDSTDQFNMTKIMYDDLGRVYQTLRFPGSETTKHFKTDNYYDRRGNRVCSGNEHSVHTETAYDGLGRQYQSRTVLGIKDPASPYSSSGVFKYNSPSPHPDFAEMDGGNGGVITLSHTQYDDTLAIASYSVELNHEETNGISLDDGNATNAIRTTALTWYDDVNRPDIMANYGAGDGTSSTTWKHTNYIPTDPMPAAPDWDSNPAAANGHQLLTEFGYNSSTGRQESVTTGTRKSGDDAGTTTRKTFTDDLGRTLFAVENWVNDYDPTGTIESVPGQNRTVGFQYDGLGQKTHEVAYNNGGSQTTQYLYDDLVSASWQTEVISPDSSGGTETVKRTYHLDGSVHTMTDQRSVVRTYTYNDRRQVKLDAVTTLSTADGHVQAIGRSYDIRGRLDKVTSYTGVAPSPTNVLNQVDYDYWSDNGQLHGKLRYAHQSHSGTVASGNGVETTEYIYDTSPGSDQFDNQLRLTQTNSVSGANTTQSYGTPGSINDRLSRVENQTLDGGTLRSSTHKTSYAYTGGGQLAEIASDGTDGIGMTQSSYSSPGNYDSWDQFGRTVKKTWENNASAVHDEFAYTYDLAGNLLTRNNTQATAPGGIQNRTYGYDDLNQLKSSDDDGTAYDRFFERDQVGNLSKIFNDPDGPSNLIHDRGHNLANELDSLKVNNTIASVGHDEAGNMTTIPKPKDLLTAFSGKYDAWNRLANLDAGATATFRYDGLNRRIIRTESGTTTHFYYNERSQVLTEISTGNGKSAIYSYHPNYVDAVAVRMRSNDEHFFTHDAQYSVTSAINRTGVVDERYSYSPYGETTVLNSNFAIKDPNDPTNSTINNEYTYTGRRLDPGTGLMYFRARYYNPQLGQFISRDPLGYVDGMSQYRAYFVPGATDPKGTRTVSGGNELPDQDQIKNLCDQLTLTANGNKSTCVNCSKTKCEEAVQSILDAGKIANDDASIWHATPVVNWNPFVGEEHKYGGYCHAWHSKFTSNCKCHARSCLSQINYTLDLHNINQFPYSDHVVSVVKNTCSGKCLVIQNWPYKQVVDPCKAGWSATDFTANGLKTWNRIAKSCGCKGLAKQDPGWGGTNELDPDA